MAERLGPPFTLGQLSSEPSLHGEEARATGSGHVWVCWLTSPTGAPAPASSLPAAPAEAAGAVDRRGISTARRRACRRHRPCRHRAVGPGHCSQSCSLLGGVGGSRLHTVNMRHP